MSIRRMVLRENCVPDRELDRREFLTRSSAAAFAVVPVGLLARLEGQAGSGSSQEDWVRAARAQIPASTESAYFQTGGIGPASRRAIAEVAERLEYQNRGPADPRYSASMAEIEPDLRLGQEALERTRNGAHSKPGHGVVHVITSSCTAGSGACALLPCSSMFASSCASTA